MTKRYELLYLIPASVNENDLPTITGKISKIISGLGGKIESDELWAKRKLNYPIKRQAHAYYWKVLYEAPTATNAKIGRELRLLPEIIRYLIAEPTPAPPPPREPIPAQPVIVEKPALPSIRKTPSPKKDIKEEKVSLEELDRKLDEILDDGMNGS
ncbi:MAG: 30S ribosomal protein S6 [Patescibacteria group bacterium]